MTEFVGLSRCNYLHCVDVPTYMVKVHRRDESLLSMPEVAACRVHIAGMVDHFLEELEDGQGGYAITVVPF